MSISLVYVIQRNMGQLSIRTIQKLKNGQTSRPVLKDIRGINENKWKSININYNPDADIEVCSLFSFLVGLLTSKDHSLNVYFVK